MFFKEEGKLFESLRVTKCMTSREVNDSRNYLHANPSDQSSVSRRFGQLISILVSSHS